MTTVGDIAGVIEELAPLSLAESWDHVGLQLGRAGASVTRIMVALDADEWAVKQAAAANCELLVSHHPLFFGGLDSVNDTTGPGRAALTAIESGIAVYAAHTNLDKAPGGINDMLAQALGLLGTRPLENSEPLYKLVVFVPEEAVEHVRNALGDAGAGVIGLYSHCSFTSAGMGSFRALEGADPAVGKAGTHNSVAEYRIEVEVGRSALPAVEAAMLAVHPYEEVAYDVYEMVGKDKVNGLGRVGNLPESVGVRDVVKQCEELFGPGVRVAGPDCDECAPKARRAAVCGGSGASLIRAAKRARADVFITGDIKYHDACLATELGLTVIDAGHDRTESVALGMWCGLLREKVGVEVVEALSTGSVWKTAGAW